MNSPNEKIRVTITGASGFVGKHLLTGAPSEWHINALSRGSAQPNVENISWRQADLFSLRSSSEALKETDVAVYLVHSMLPSTRLFQGNFADADLLIADNFARACIKNKVKQIIYLGGLVPVGTVSKHLASRQEVEDVFKDSGIPYTILRAGMVAGQGGSSFEILRNLVTNLPGMILPKWTQANTQVIYIDDLVRLIQTAVMNKDYFNKTINAVNGESLNYENLIRITCRILKKRILLLRVPINSTKFSKLWVSIFGKTNYELVSPLIDSLLCELPQGPPSELIAPLIHERSFEGMLKRILEIPGEQKKRYQAKLIHPNTVRSIQRLPSNLSMNCGEIAREYENWLSKAALGLIKVDSTNENGLVIFNFIGVKWPLLILKPMLDGPDMQRAKFNIVGGLLSKRSDCGWLEFRQVANRKFTLVSINEFVPTLPWYVYRFTQAILHKWTMTSFAKHLFLKR
ncbi:MAG: NAD(P)H-binding protein [Bdellovibrio sp.]|nr:NAD(P)H-binding protein [Bdellovibrio sp.]